MSAAVREFDDQWTGALAAFNTRLAEGGAAFIFGDGAGSPAADSLRPRRNWLLVDDGGSVRGAYGIRHDRFRFRGSDITLDYYAAPVAEGVVNPRYAAAGVQLVMDATNRFDSLYGLGGGPLSEPSPRLLLKAGWKAHCVPLFLRVERASNVLRHAPAAGRLPLARRARGALALSGIGTIAARMAHGAQSLRHFHLRPRGIHDIEEVADLAPHADAVWRAARDRYTLVSCRDAQHVAASFPREASGMRRFVVRRRGAVIGWNVIAPVVTGWRRHFGPVKVSAIIDSFGAPEDLGDVIAGALRAVRADTPEVIVTNHNHPAACAALRGLGFFEGPRILHFLASKRLAATLRPFAETLAQAHLTRADGDGPAGLIQPSEGLVQ